MPTYRAYIVGTDGHYVNVHEFDLPDDGAATTKALSLVDGHDVELWEGERAIGRFKRHKPPTPPVPGKFFR